MDQSSRGFARKVDKAKAFKSEPCAAIPVAVPHGRLQVVKAKSTMLGHKVAGSLTIGPQSDVRRPYVVHNHKGSTPRPKASKLGGNARNPAQLKLAAMLIIPLRKTDVANGEEDCKGSFPRLVGRGTAKHPEYRTINGKRVKEFFN